jgi:hypothetical protein
MPGTRSTEAVVIVVGGAGIPVLRELGIPFTGGPPTISNGYAFAGSEVSRPHASERRQNGRTRT